MDLDYKNMKNKGFTLIELLVVIAIIGILSGIVITALSGAREQAQISKIRSEMAQIRSAAELYALENDNSYSTLSSAGNQGANCLSFGMYGDPNTVRPYVKSIVETISVGNAGANIGCRADKKNWAFYVTNPNWDNFNWCVDSKGYSGPVGSSGWNNGNVCNPLQ